MKSPGTAGFTLVEVLIATLLLAIGVAGVFSVTLSARFQEKRNTARDEINQYGRKLQEDLKSYVTVTVDGSPSVPIDATGMPNKSTHHPNDTCTAWALSYNCTHDVSSMLPADLRGPPFNARLTYEVSAPAAVGAPRKVVITMKWDDQ